MSVQTNFEPLLFLKTLQIVPSDNRYTIMSQGLGCLQHSSFIINNPTLITSAIVSISRRNLIDWSSITIIHTLTVDCSIVMYIHG